MLRYALIWIYALVFIQFQCNDDRYCNIIIVKEVIPYNISLDNCITLLNNVYENETTMRRPTTSVI